MAAVSFQISHLNFENVNGERLSLRIQRFSRLCEEFIVENQPFPFKKWLLCTVILTALFLHNGFHHQQSFILSIICVALIVLSFIKLNWKVTQESLLVIQNVGLQITIRFASGRKVAKFIAWENIKGVVINEAITYQRALFYLAVLLECGSGGVTKISPIFQHSLPRLDCLKKIYQNLSLIR